MKQRLNMTLILLMAMAWQNVMGQSCNSGSSVPIAGFTAEKYKANEGLLTLTQACQTEFPGTRVCTSKEIIMAYSIPERPVPTGATQTADKRAWVLPSPKQTQKGSATLWVDATGINGTPENFTCDAWSSSSRTGLTVSWENREQFSIKPFYGKFSLLSCGQEARIACCGPEKAGEYKPPN